MNIKRIMQLSALLAISIVSLASYADHSWGSFKWKTPSTPLTLELVDNVNLSWKGHLVIASNDWSAVPDVLITNIIDRTEPNAPLSCDPQTGNIQVCNAEYGDTGWLGIAQIYGRGKTITAGTAKLNDTYYNTASYDTPAWRQMVMCQEIAHTFGLDHQDEVQTNVNLGSCMDYTNDPDGSIDGELSNEYPNLHDYDQLAIIYAGGTDGGSKDGGGGCNPKSPKCNSATVKGKPTSIPGNPRAWGRLISPHGGIEVYEKDLGNGYRVRTHVTWTLEHANNHRH